MRKYTTVTGDDWEGLYVDGKLVYENHSIPLDVFAKFAGIELDEQFCDVDWLNDLGSLPSSLDNVKLETPRQ